MIHERDILQAVTQASSTIAAQLEDLRSEVHKHRLALETLADYIPGLVEAVRNLYEIVPAVEQLAASMHPRVATEPPQSTPIARG